MQQVTSDIDTQNFDKFEEQEQPEEAGDGGGKAAGKGGTLRLLVSAGHAPHGR